MKKILTALAAVAALTVTGCSSPASGGLDENPRGSNAPSSSDPAPEPDNEEESGPAKFGKTVQYEDGLHVRVSKPRRYQPSAYAVTGKGNQHVRFVVRLVNHTGKPFDPSGFTTTLQSGNREADEIFDFENGLEGAPTTKLLDGREVEFDVAYTVRDPKDLVLEVSPDFLEHEPVLFQR